MGLTKTNASKFFTHFWAKGKGSEIHNFELCVICKWPSKCLPHVSFSCSRMKRKCEVCFEYAWSMLRDNDKSMDSTTKQSRWCHGKRQIFKVEMDRTLLREGHMNIELKPLWTGNNLQQIRPRCGAPRVKWNHRYKLATISNETFEMEGNCRGLHPEGIQRRRRDSSVTDHYDNRWFLIRFVDAVLDWCVVQYPA